MTLPTAQLENIAKSNALMAWDQDDVESFRQNALDTVTEEGGDDNDFTSVGLLFEKYFKEFSK